MTAPATHPALPGALVTGAAARIGRAIATALAAEGRAVAVHYNRSGKAAEETVSAIAESGGRAVAIKADLADASAAAELVPRAAEALAGLDAQFGCLVNNASLFEFDRVGELGPESFDRHMAVNARAPALIMQAFAGHIAADPVSGAVVINILDQKLRNPNPDHLSYTISKYALEGLTRTMALACAPDIRVVGVAPGLTLPGGALDEAAFATAAARLPLGRATAVEDIAATVCYVAAAPSITGQTILVDAGQHLAATSRDVAFTEPEDEVEN
ncbi:MAG: SDR family oxidoreductase [Alphaproteobacteria bacterium]|nr:SDR family oxidoreductase [Alphaproteobacteria bacterium]